MKLTKNKLPDLIFFGLFAGLLVAAVTIEPRGDGLVLPGGYELGSTCWFNKVTNLPCAFCGMTRSFVSAAHGDLASAFQYHLGGPILFGWMFIVAVLVPLSALRSGPGIIGHRSIRASFSLVVGLAVCVGMIRLLITFS
jgi:hypothetical protein